MPNLHTFAEAKQYAELVVDAVDVSGADELGPGRLFVRMVSIVALVIGMAVFQSGFSLGAARTTKISR